jgi:hypothetical protein
LLATHGEVPVVIESRGETQRWAWTLIASVVLCACSADKSANARYHMANCKQQIIKGYCLEGNDASVSKPADASHPSGNGSSGSPDSGTARDGRKRDAGVEAGAADSGTVHDTTGEACDAKIGQQYCYFGADGTDGTGMCHGGHRDCVAGTWGPCSGEVRPNDETCNGQDDDCDGKTDEAKDLPVEYCTCGKQQCIKGEKVCQKTTDPVPEICNGKDDNCNGVIDEGADMACIDGNAGCVQQGDVITCKGRCRAGLKTCSNGMLGECANQVFPDTSDACSSGTAIDDDCDGMIDEDCQCTPNTSKPCYGGPAGTVGIGECKQGTQMCGSNMKYGPCTGDTQPQDEDCTNQGHDDDCDGKTDEIPGLGATCATGSSGMCKTGTNMCQGGALTCVAPQPQAESCNMEDDDCDGYIDEDFHLSSDNNNCGTCGMKCPGGTTCCAGACVDTNGDAKNCGMCDNPCGSSILCCAGKCILPDRNNCSACGQGCNTNQMCCSNTCTDINTTTHCGSCSTQCSGVLPACCAAGSSFSCGMVGCLL